MRSKAWPSDHATPKSVSGSRRLLEDCSALNLIDWKRDDQSTSQRWSVFERTKEGVKGQSYGRATTVLSDRKQIDQQM